MRYGESSNNVARGYSRQIHRTGAGTATRKLVVAYNIIWEFQVPREHVADFEGVYGPRGEWALLFGRAEGFLGIELLRSTEQQGRYLTVDRWKSQAAFEAFRARFVGTTKHWTTA
jgi:heme-degrading monooxygenase HmoA